MIAPPAYILSGGRSSRFGSDKARAQTDTHLLIQRVAETLEPIAESITVVADRPDKYADLGLRTIADDRPLLGPLGGIEAALADCPSGRLALVTSCDLLFLDRGRALRDLIARSQPDDRTIVYRSQRWHPFPGLYSPSLLACVREQLQTDDRSMRTLLDHHARAIPCDAFESWAADANTPEALKRAINLTQDTG